jgi:hypothetical protein
MIPGRNLNPGARDLGFPETGTHEGLRASSKSHFEPHSRELGGSQVRADVTKTGIISVENSAGIGGGDT